MLIAPSPAAPIVTGMGLDTPAGQLLRRNSRDIMSLPGVGSAGASIDEPNVLRINFADASFARLGDNVLRDTIDGVKLVITSTKPSTDPIEWWADSADQLMNAVCAMPGVIDVDAFPEHGMRYAIFKTASPAASARLKPLINDKLASYIVSWSPLPA